eukprot:Skav228595  [mRNA]  locus=scaffold1161:78241:94363:- [translate_table: standard]
MRRSRRICSSRLLKSSPQRVALDTSLDSALWRRLLTTFRSCGSFESLKGWSTSGFSSRLFLPGASERRPPVAVVRGVASRMSCLALLALAMRLPTRKTVCKSSGSKTRGSKMESPKSSSSDEEDSGISSPAPDESAPTTSGKDELFLRRDGAPSSLVFSMCSLQAQKTSWTTRRPKLKGLKKPAAALLASR